MRKPIYILELPGTQAHTQFLSGIAPELTALCQLYGIFKYGPHASRLSFLRSQDLLCCSSDV